MTRPWLIGLLTALALMTCSLGSIDKAAAQETARAADLLAEAGAALAGWTRVPIPPGAKLSEESPWSYDPESGVLTCAGDQCGHEWLRFDTPMSDFRLTVEWRFEPIEQEAPRYNSGVFVRCSEDGRIWHQAQCGAQRGGFLFGDTMLGGELKRVNLSKEVADSRVKAAGQWNHYEITARAGQIELKVDGETTCTWRDCEVSEGYVGLEAEGYRVAFRNVRLEPLD